MERAEILGGNGEIVKQGHSLRARAYEKAVKIRDSKSKIKS